MLGKLGLLVIEVGNAALAFCKMVLIKVKKFTFDVLVSRLLTSLDNTYNSPTIIANSTSQMLC